MENDKPVVRLTDFECKAQNALGDKRLEHRRGCKSRYLNLKITFEIKS